MITDVLLHVTGFITHTIDALGYSGVILLMAIESAAIPLPSEIIMPFAGSLAESGRFTLFGLGLAGALGSVVGSLVTYVLGYYGGRPLIQRYGHWVFLSEKDLDATEKFFKKFGPWSAFLGRMVPVLRTFISIPAGIGKASIVPFTIAAFVGSFIWSYCLAWIGLGLGENWDSLERYFRQFEILIAGVILILIIYWIRRHLKGRLHKN